jgi:Zn-dependent peptidase ImmA (M78 family)
MGRWKGYNAGANGPMQLDCRPIRFVSHGRGNHEQKLAGLVLEIRKALRSNDTLAQIAEKFGVSESTLRRFIKRRNLCDLKQRAFMSKFYDKSTHHR